MRVWTLHPKYLDTQGLLALWRETLLAQKVLRGETKGYRTHPQLIRFRTCSDPLAAIGSYLQHVASEASGRGYAFDGSKIGAQGSCNLIEETDGQLLYEWKHLKRKLALRNPRKLEELKDVSNPEPNPLFFIVPGNIRDWEKQPPPRLA